MEAHQNVQFRSGRSSKERLIEQRRSRGSGSRKRTYRELPPNGGTIDGAECASGDSELANRPMLGRVPINLFPGHCAAATKVAALLRGIEIELLSLPIIPSESSKAAAKGNRRIQIDLYVAMLFDIGARSLVTAPQRGVFRTVLNFIPRNTAKYTLSRCLTVRRD